MKLPFFVWVIVSVLLAGVFLFIIWYYFDANYKIQGYIGLGSSILTIFGFILTIFQISQLRSQQETIENTRNELRLESFKYETLIDLKNIQAKIKALILEIDKQEKFTPDSLSSYTDGLHEVNNIIIGIKTKQETFDRHAFKCEDCLEQIDNAKRYIMETIEQKGNKVISKILLKDKVRAIETRIVEIESKIRY